MAMPVYPTGRLTFWPLFGVIYLLVCGGPYGIEEMVSAAGPGAAFVLLVLAPLVWGLPMALVMAELGAGWPVLGGYYRWTRTAFGDFWGFQQGWWQLLASWVDNALYPVIVSDYAATLVPSLGSGGKLAVRLAVIILFSLTNALGVRLVGRLSLLFSVLVLLPLVPLVGLGLWAWAHNPLLPFTPPGTLPLHSLGLGLLIVMWNYAGYESMSTAIHEVDAPQRHFPRVLLWSIPLAVASYALPLLAGLAAYGNWEVWKSGTLSLVAGALGGGWLQAAVLVGAAASSMGMFNGYVLAYTRLPQAMAQDGFLPHWLDRLHPRWGTPVRSIIANGCIYAALALFEFRALVVIDTILFSAGYILLFFTLVRFRALFPETPRPFRVPGGRVGVWVVAVVPTLVAIGACLAADFKEIGPGLAAAASGPLAYLVARRVCHTATGRAR